MTGIPRRREGRRLVKLAAMVDRIVTGPTENVVMLHQASAS